MKMKFIKCYNDTQYRYSHRQIKPIKQQAHFKNILHVPTSAAVMKTARQTAICTCTICRKQITSSVTLIETLTKLTLSKKELISGKHGTTFADSKIVWTDIALNVDNLLSQEGSW